MTHLAASLDRAIQAAGVAIVGVSIGDSADRATWTVSPASLQADAQPIIDAFDLNDPNQPRLLNPEVIIERMTTQEVAFLAGTPAFAKLWAMLIGRITPVNVNGATFKGGWAQLKAAGLAAGLWPDAATAEARLAAITA